MISDTVMYRACGSAVAGTATTADRSLSFHEDTVPIHGSAVRQLIVNTAVATLLAHIENITVKVGTRNVIDCLATHLAQYYSFMGKKAEWASGSTRFSIIPPGPPLVTCFGPAGPSELGLAAYGKIRLELYKNATPAASTAQLHEGIETDRQKAALFASTFIGTNANIAAGAQNNQNFYIQGNGLLAGLVLPDIDDMNRLELWQGTELVHSFTTAPALLEAQEQARANAATTVAYFACPRIPIIQGQTRLVIDTAAGWNANNQITVHALQPLYRPRG